MTEFLDNSDEADEHYRGVIVDYYDSEALAPEVTATTSVSSANYYGARLVIELAAAAGFVACEQLERLGKAVTSRRHPKT